MLRAALQKSQILQKSLYVLHGLIPILKNFFLYSCGSLILRSISIVVAPITMSMLSPDQYGVLALLNSFISIACIICGFGLRQALSLEYFHYPAEHHTTLVQELIATYSTLALPLLCIAVLCHPYINNYFFLGVVPTYLLIASFILIFFYFFSELLYQILQYEHKALELTTLQTSIALVTVIINLILLCYLQLGIASIIVGQLIGILVVCGVGIKKAKLHLFSKKIPHPTTIKKYLVLGVPFIPSMLFAWLLAAGDRWVLAQHATLSDVGIYSVADTFGQIFQMVVLLPFSNAYLPYLMKKFADNTNNLVAVEQWNRHVMWLFIPTLFFVFSFGYLVTKPLVLWLLPATYHDALTYVWLLLIGYLLLVCSYFPAALIQFKKKTTFLAFALCIPALINIFLNMMLVPHYKIIGCVLATVFSYGLYLVIMMLYNYRLTKSLASS
jgi:O-antigen/teichoic acid export membrane protein